VELRGRRFAFLGLLLFSARPALAVAPEPFAREDWVISVEPMRLDDWGVNHWGVTNFDLTYRAIQRGKHHLETKYVDNWRFGSETGGVRGVALRSGSTLLDFALFVGPQNFAHAMGHDSRARELSRDYPGSHGRVSRRFTSVLPVWFGGKELGTTEKVTTSNGADLSTLTNSTLWEMQNQFAYFHGKRIMAEERANSTQLANLIFNRLLMLQPDWKEPDQVCATARLAGGTTPFQCRGGSGGAEDWSNYVIDLNTGRYGVANTSDYRIKIADLKRANRLQFLDPVFLVSAYRYGADYIGHGRNASRIPMIPLPGTQVSYLPGLRVDLSPFGIEYIQDNYFRYKRTLVNAFWTRGDNRYEKRLGAGLDVDNLPLWGGVTAGVFGQLYKQPLVSRIVDRTPLSATEVGVLHNVWHYGASLRVPLRTFGPPADPKQVILTLKAGRKNTGWIPGEYIKGNTYLETGLGVRL